MNETLEWPERDQGKSWEEQIRVLSERMAADRREACRRAFVEGAEWLEKRHTDRPLSDFYRSRAVAVAERVWPE